MSGWLAALTASALLLGCADDTEVSAGDVSTGTADAQVVADVISGDGVSETDVAQVADVVDDAKDLPIITEIAEWADLSWVELYPDAEVAEVADAAPEPDQGPADVADATQMVDALDDDAVTADGLGGDASGSDADGSSTFDTFLSDCEELGIGASWEGAFSGGITYDIETGGLFTPEEGILPVDGTLGFDIECIDSKYVVTGTLDGVASVVGQGEFPFVLSLGGFYTPATGALKAQMTDGEVSLYDVVIVYFDGGFDGTLLEDGTFSGIWSATSTGTNTPLVTGIANGTGPWTASEPAE